MAHAKITNERMYSAELQADPVVPVKEIGPVLLSKTEEGSVGLPQQSSDRMPDDGGHTFAVWEDARIARLINALVSGRFTEIVPMIDISVKGGVIYPEVDALLEVAGDESTCILEDLASNGILDKKPFEKLHVDHEGSFQVVPVERCPNCDSGNLVSGKLIEHFACGNVGLEQDFKSGFKYICNKCKKELKLLGTDYRYVGMQYKCLNCNEIFPTPVIKWRSLKTDKTLAVEELRDVCFYSYSLNAKKRKWLEFQLKPKDKLIDFLKLQGYEVQEAAQMRGGSGAVHTIDILATRDDGLAKFQVGIGILVALPGEEEIRLEELFNFDTRFYDMGINYKVVLAIPKLSAEAMKFAERQKIGIFESKDMEDMMSFINTRLDSKADLKTKSKALYHGEMGTESWTRNQIAVFLQNRGYSVFEKGNVLGGSGVEHIFDIFAQRDDVIVRPTLAIAIATANGQRVVGIDKIIKFDAEAYDAGITNKAFIGIPEVSMQVKKFAERQRIRIFEKQKLEEIIKV